MFCRLSGLDEFVKRVLLLIIVVISVITSTVTNLLNKHESDLDFLQLRVDKTIRSQLEVLQNRDNYCHLTYPFLFYPKYPL